MNKLATCIATLIALCLALPATAQPSRMEMIDGDRIVIIDGDTVALPCPAGIGLCKSERIRIYNIDAPETGNARCEAERVRGLEAKAALAAQLRGRSITLTRCEPCDGAACQPRCTDPFGRTLGRLSNPGGDIGAALIASGHALPWQPGPAARAARFNTWCRRTGQ